MSDSTATDRQRVLRAYPRTLQQTHASGQATEHSYRPALKGLIEAMAGDSTEAINEPAHGEYGAPDFIVQRHGVPIGHIECKDIGQNLDAAEASEQLRRYRAALPNLILTDYLEFRWYADGELRETARLGRFDSGGTFAPQSGGRDAVRGLLEAFFNAEAATIGDPADLARRMAGKTRLLRESIRHILEEDAAAPAELHELLASYREVLISDLGAAEFADLQAQTAAYGLFAARCLHEGAPDGFTRESAVFAQTTPFLRDVFGRVAGPSADSRIAWIVDDLALLLARADMAAILADFGQHTKQEDPVVHFYEDFLAAYDPKLRELRGVYYTPEPVVSYIVRSVDRLLRDEFDLADGLADTATVEVEVKAEDGETQTKTSPRVLILDPAAGTGTFLREAVSSVRRTIEDNGIGGAWPGYVRDHLLPRLFGFELLMAPYAICHLKLAIEIGGEDGAFTLPAGERLNVFLTNSLEEAHEAVSGPMFAAEIAHETREADAVKRDRPVMVVLGNPPYSGHSANKGKWIKDLIRDYKRDIPELRKPGQAKWLSDDYVKFIRFAQHRIEQTGEGVLGFVTNHSYLDNPTFRGMRQSLMTTFDEIRLLDLHGNSKKKERAPDGGPDENVFDIQQGVAIGIFVKRKNGSTDQTRVFHADLWGERVEATNGGKYGWLAANDLVTTDWTRLSPKSPHYLFVPRDEALLDEYEAAWSLPAIFSPNGDPAPGIVTTHDQFAISWSPAEAASKVERLLATTSEGEARSIWRLCSQDRGDTNERRRNSRAAIGAIALKPSTTAPLTSERLSSTATWRFTGVNVSCVTCWAGRTWGSSRLAKPVTFGQRSLPAPSLDTKHWPPTTSIASSRSTSTRPRGTRWNSALRSARRTSQRRSPRRSRAPLRSTSRRTGQATSIRRSGRRTCSITSTPCCTARSTAAATPTSSSRTSRASRCPGAGALFAVLAGRGERLAALHLMEASGADRPTFGVDGDNRVERVRYAEPSGETPGRVWINGEQHFEGVSRETWQLTIGGYRPAEKWLKDRKGRALSFNDTAWYQRVCAALAETPRVMDSIDEAITAHGGWPLSAPARNS